MKKYQYLMCLVSLLCANAFGASIYVGPINLIEQYAPGANGSGALCYVRVPAEAVANKPSCAAGGVHYYYSWECESPRRQGMMSLAVAAYMGNRKVQLIGTGECSPHPQYENLNYFIISDNP